MRNWDQQYYDLMQVRIGIYTLYRDSPKFICKQTLRLPRISRDALAGVASGQAQLASLWAETKVVLIRLPARYDAAHAAARMFDIVQITRNQVDMRVQDGLARRSADIHADVVAGRRMAFIQHGLCLPEQRQQCLLLLSGEIKETGDMAKRDEQEVAGRDWIQIAARIRKFVVQKRFDLIDAKRARHLVTPPQRR